PSAVHCERASHRRGGRRVSMAAGRSALKETLQLTGFVSVRNLRKSFGSFWAIDGVSFEIEQGELLVLLGPSGCGKTTTLRCIGGLERPDAGQILIDGREVTNAGGDANIFLPPEARGMGMVAQSYAIWPHMSVFENVAFPDRKSTRLNSSHVK